MTGDGLSSGELSDAAVSRIQAVADVARMRYREIVARDPSVRAMREGRYGDELSACLHDVRDAYLAEGNPPGAGGAGVRVLVDDRVRGSG